MEFGKPIHDDEFVWTDELVEECSEEVGDHMAQYEGSTMRVIDWKNTRMEVVKRFKERHTPKTVEPLEPGFSDALTEWTEDLYENLKQIRDALERVVPVFQKYPDGILDVYLNGPGRAITSFNNTKLDYQQWCKELLFLDKHDIYRVKNSHDEILCIGDETNNGIITGFQISDSGLHLLAMYDSNAYPLIFINLVHPKKKAKQAPRLTEDKFELRVGDMAQIVSSGYERIQIELTEELKQLWEAGLIWTDYKVYKHAEYASAYYQFNVKKFSEKEVRSAVHQYMKANCGIDIIEVLKKQADESATKN